MIIGQALWFGSTALLWYAIRGLGHSESGRSR
ncbi:hypothetical protein NONO_c43550 [Nocardia nova SH22a]|uniref:Uncharacterized protein n=1 Tax=Nocardia nova SH22a TaxID=1415166 RepID=W5TIZ7_9NOCA|nr:hypothetical protein NONO_c43550 [Nocardia nova SH22a]